MFATVRGVEPALIEIVGDGPQRRPRHVELAARELLRAPLLLRPDLLNEACVCAIHCALDRCLGRR